MIKSARIINCAILSPRDKLNNTKKNIPSVSNNR